MKVDTSSSLFTPVQIKKIEKAYKATYVCETCLKNSSGGWVNGPAAIFYTKKKHPHGSNYLALYFVAPFDSRDEPRLMITDGISATREPFTGGVFDDETLYFSRWRHDYRCVPGGFVDGGRDYFRSAGAAETVKLRIVKDRVKVVQ